MKLGNYLEEITSSGISGTELPFADIQERPIPEIIWKKQKKRKKNEKNKKNIKMCKQDN